MESSVASLVELASLGLIIMVAVTFIGLVAVGLKQRRDSLAQDKRSKKDPAEGA